MKILICAGIFPPEAGGPATYSKEIAEAFAERGHIVKVITYSTPSSSPPYQGGERVGVVRITRSWLKPWHYYKYYRAVLRHGRDADLIYAQGPVSDGYPSYLANQKLKKPFLVKITGDYSWEQARVRGLTDKMIDEFQNLDYYPKKVRKMREVQKIVCQAADLIITPSEYLKNLVAGWGIEERKIRVIYNAIEIPDTHGLYQRISADNQRKSAFVIVSAGRDVPWKGFEVLRQAIDELSNSMELDTKVRLEILQNLSREELLAKLKSADLFVLNSGYEGFAHSVLEAMACGVPVITTTAGGNPEVITRGTEGGSDANGILVEYNNKEQLKEAIVKMYRSPELRGKFIENGKKTVEKFSLENMINATEELLKQCAF